MAAATQPGPDEILLQASIGFMASAAVSVVANLSIADHLAGGPRTSQELAAATGANEDRLYRVLRSTEMLGLVREVSPRMFALTPVGDLLRSDHPRSALDIVKWLTEPKHFQCFSELLWSVRTGEAAASHVLGTPVWEYMQKDKPFFDLFNRGMTSLSAAAIPAILDAYDFSGIGTLIEVAGGHGTLLAAILRKHPNIKGVLFDQPHVLPGAAQHLTGDLEARSKVVGGNFFEHIPEGDACLMKHIIHDWHDEPATQILRNCRNALASASNPKLLIVDAVVPEGPEPHPSKLADLEMMVFPDGRERTAAEFHTLLKNAGFRVLRIIPTKSWVSIVEATIA